MIHIVNMEASHNDWVKRVDVVKQIAATCLDNEKNV
jgi:hypothetical protein